MHAELGQVNEGFLLFLMAKGLVKPKKFSLNPLFQEYEMLDHYDLLYLDMTISDGSSATKDIVIVQNASDFVRFMRKESLIHLRPWFESLLMVVEVSLR